MPDDQQPAAAPYASQTLAQALGTQQLEQLVAPIALYPDLLIAQMLTAATYPAQVIDADHWLQSQGNAPPEQIVAGADVQSWDPSVKALTAFPQVLAQMDQNLRWTTELGNAYYNQPQDVLNVVQEMRQRAEAAGNLQNSAQESVTDDRGYIQVAPTNPQVMYLPTYDPWAVYGAPVRPYPGFSLIGALGSFFGSSPVQFGLQFALSAFSHSPWGCLQWGLNWLSQAVLFHQTPFYSHSRTVADWGLPHGGPRAAGWRGGGERFPNNGYRTDNRGYRTGGGYGFNGGRENGYRGALPQPSRPGQGFGGRGYEGFDHGGYRSPQNFYRRPANSGLAYARPGAPGYNRQPMPMTRPQESYRPGMGSGFVGNNSSRGAGNPAFGNRGFGGYGGYGGGYAGGRAAPSPQMAYRAPGNDFGRGQSAERGFAGGRAGGQARPERSGSGFHPFGGGGHEERSFKAPKESRGGGHFGGGGHSGGGHSSGGGKHHR